ncbi:MAG: ChbG/HpnK family deacetylase [Nitrospiraceae bacterium]|nr:ChbG/HpnK family deacetylase [Nitrospiraceae bacterium]
MNCLTSSTLALVLLAAGAAVAADADADTEPTYAERLGWPAGSRIAIFHVDDAGMCHDANVGTIEALEKGVATSTSIMMPCAWVGEFARYVAANPTVDAGLHLTLTSEWKNYRWGPVAGKSAVPGLVDKEGCMWHEVEQVVANASPDEIETEIRAQLDRALTLGLKPTHLDSHMGTLFASPAFFERYLKVGAEKNIPVLVPGGHLTHVKAGLPLPEEAVKMMAQKAWDAGLPVVDDIHVGSYEGMTPEDKKGLVIDFLRTLKPGITEFIVHCTRPSENFQHISSSGRMRLAELNAMCDPEVKKVVEEEGIILTTWREMKERRDKVK